MIGTLETGLENKIYYKTEILELIINTTIIIKLKLIICQ